MVLRPQSPSLWASCARGPEITQVTKATTEKAPSSFLPSSFPPFLSFSATLRRSTGGRVSSRKCSHAAWFRTHDDEHGGGGGGAGSSSNGDRGGARAGSRGGRRTEAQRGDRRASMAEAAAAAAAPAIQSSQRRDVRGLHLCEAYGIIPESGRASEGPGEGASGVCAVLCLSLRCDAWYAWWTEEAKGSMYIVR